MPRETLAELRSRIAELEARNAALSAETAALTARIAAPTATEPVARPTERRHGSHVGRSVLAGILVVLGLVLTPVALLVNFAQAQVSDTEAFVAAYAPLVESPEVQAAIADAVVDAINENVDIDSIISGVIAGIQSADPTGLSTALNLVRGPIVDGINELVRTAVTSLVASEWFPTVWEQTLRLTHSQLNAVLRGDPNAIAQISGDTISIQLGPVISALREQLIANDITIARLIPTDLDVTIPVGTVAGIGQVKTIYAVALASGVWLPIIAAALLVGGIAVAPRRSGWVMGASISLAVIGILAAIGLSIGRTATMSTGVIDPDALGIAFDAATGGLAVTIAAVIAIAVLGIVAAWFAGPTRLAARSRAAVDHFPAIARQRLALTNPVSRFLTRHRGLAFWLIAAAVVVTIVFFRPLTVWVVIVAVLLGAVLVLLVETFRSGAALDAPAGSVDEALADAPAQDLAEDVAR